MAVIYRHIRLDNNEVFYVGIGKNENRAYDTRRSNIWKSITNKTDYEVQVLKSDLIWEDACELEKILISYYGRRDLGLGTLVNMTDGGDGTIGFTPTDEMNKKRSEKLEKENNSFEKNVINFLYKLEQDYSLVDKITYSYLLNISENLKQIQEEDKNKKDGNKATTTKPMESVANKL